MEILNSVSPVVAIAPTNNPDVTPIVGAIVDQRGYDGLMYLIATGELSDTDATFAVLLEDGDAANLSDAAAVPDALLVGTEALAGFTFAADGKCRKLGYKGPKRYTRLTITPSANAANAVSTFIAAIALRSGAWVKPTANPPA